MAKKNARTGYDHSADSRACNREQAELRQFLEYIDWANRRLPANRRDCALLAVRYVAHRFGGAYGDDVVELRGPDGELIKRFMAPSFYAAGREALIWAHGSEAAFVAFLASLY